MKTFLRLGLPFALAIFIGMNRFAWQANRTQRTPAKYTGRTTYHSISRAMVFTGPEEVVTFTPAELQYIPDENISFLKFDQVIHLWVQGFIPGQSTGHSTYYFHGPDFDHLQAYRDGNGRIIAALAPSGLGFDKDMPHQQPSCAPLTAKIC